MAHCNACGADAETSAEPGWMRFDLPSLRISTDDAATIVPEIVMTACGQHSTTVLAQFNRQRAGRDSMVRSWLDRHVPTKIETLD
jgi:hypothetical protein